MMNDPILSQYIDVFNGLGALPGEYTIQVKPDVVPVINPHAGYQLHCET